MADMTTHLMLDDVNVSTIEAHDAPAFAVAGYVNGLYANWNALVAHYVPTSKFLLSISVFADASAGAQALDIEPGDASIPQAAAWVKATAAAGRQANDLRWYPKVYISAGSAQALIDALSAAGVPRNGYMLWSAHYGWNGGQAHICGPNTCGYPQADATQYADTFQGASLDATMAYGYFFSGPPVSPVPSPVPTPAPPITPPAEPLVESGSSGPAVVELQQLLNAKANAGLAVDGQFGPATLAAVKAWQQAHGLMVDGIVGALTWSSLYAAPAWVPPAPAPNPAPPPKPPVVVPPPPPAPAPPPPAPADPVLREGATGPSVATLQTLLNAKIGAGLHVDGDFGPATLAAVHVFQSRLGLVVDGIVGPATWAALKAAPNYVPPPPPPAPTEEPVLAEGARGAAVQLLQRLLNVFLAQRGAGQIAVDGIFGPATKQAVILVQQYHRLFVDGIVGPQTWGALGNYR